jgi:phosphoglycolate phosphatase-like HAD superfamily hydrolase
MIEPRVIIWDFDGVIALTDEIRELGFVSSLSEFQKEKVDLLIEYHRANGGLSRYAKFKYFFENISALPNGKSIEDYLDFFSQIMRKELFDRAILNLPVLDFIIDYEGQQYIASGSDQKELRDLCVFLGIDGYFNGIFGSPIPKNELVQSLIVATGKKRENFVLVGDSINDHEAAIVNGINFVGYSKDFNIVRLSNFLLKDLN